MASSFLSFPSHYAFPCSSSPSSVTPNVPQEATQCTMSGFFFRQDLLDRVACSTKQNTFIKSKFSTVRLGFDRTLFYILNSGKNNARHKITLRIQISLRALLSCIQSKFVGKRKMKLHVIPPPKSALDPCNSGGNRPTFLTSLLLFLSPKGTVSSQDGPRGG